jgi:hypothetical protein
VVENDGKPKYALHAFRHFFASWCGRGAKKSPLIKRSRQTLHKPAVDRSEKLAGFSALALFTP